MVVEFLLPSTVLTWVADEIFGAFKQKYVEPGISKLLFTPDDYKIELVNSINNVIEKYEKIYPPSGKFPFYHHKETLARLSNYILFNEKDGNILRALNFSEIQNIDTPTLEQVEHFYNFFIEEITNNLKLKQLYIEENYKEKIFLIYKEISLIKNIIEDLVSKIPESDTLVKKWINQIYENLKKIKTVTALEEIDHFESEVLPTIQISNQNKALIYFIKALCLNENFRPNEALEYFEQACKLDKENTSFQAWNLYFQYLFKNIEITLPSIHKALETNLFDPLLNSILTIEALKQNQSIPGDIPITVLNKVRFKRIVYKYYLENRTLENALDYFKLDNTNIDGEIEQISIDNYGYLDFYFQLNFIKLINKYPNNLLFESDSKLKNSKELQGCIYYFEKFLAKLKNAEKYKLYALYDYLHNVTLFFRDGDKSNLNNAYSIFKQNSEAIIPYYFNLLKSCFSQVGDYSTALKIFDEKEHAPEEYYLKSVLYGKLGDEVNRVECFRQLIKEIKNINDINIDMLLDGIFTLAQEPDILYPFYVAINENNIEINGINKDIIIATKGLVNEDFKPESLRILENNFKPFNTELSNSKNLIAYCRVLHAYKQWGKIVDLLSKKDSLSPESEGLLIDALWFDKQLPNKLLSILEKWRNSDNIQYSSYILREIRLNELLSLWDKVESIASIGKKKFPEDFRFNYYLSISYLKQDLKDQYCNSIREFNIIDLQFSNFQFLIQGLLSFQEYNQAIEYAYLYATKYKEPEHRMFFFQAFVLNSDKINYYVPIYCEKGYFVKVENNLNSIVVNEIDNKNIFNNLLEKKVGDTIGLSGAMRTTEIKYTIKSIIHKYDILFAEIHKEAEMPELTGLQMQVFRFKEGATGEEMRHQLVELFGKSGDDRSFLIEKSFNQYVSGEISFLQLTRTIFQDDIFDTYFQLINSPKIGIRILSNVAFNETRRLYRSDEKFCLDITSIILFCQLQKSSCVDFPKRFIISKHTLEYFEEALANIQTEVKPKLSLNITSTGVIPFDSTEYHKQKLDLLNSCIDWINQNCLILTSSEKLSFLLQFEEENPTLNSLTLSYLDSFALTGENEALLISDEKIAVGIFHFKNQILSSECYLRDFHSELSNDMLYKFLLERNFIGLTLPLSYSKQIAEAIVDGKNENILQNLSFKNSSNPSNVFVLMESFRHILELNISEKNKIGIIGALFENLFDEMYNNITILKPLIHLVTMNIFKTFYTDKKNCKIIYSQLELVLLANNIKIEDILNDSMDYDEP